jgi:hypothetical protein
MADSKISNLESHVLISRMILEHKLDNKTKEHLLELLNCFVPKG